MIAINLIFWIESARDCGSKNTNNGGKIVSKMITTLFNSLGIIFFLSGVTMALTLRKYYPEFYRDYGKLIWTATFCLALPLFVRGINSHYYLKSKKYFEWY